jgi:hypothetical protein
MASEGEASERKQRDENGRCSEAWFNKKVQEHSWEQMFGGQTKLAASGKCHREPAILNVYRVLFEHDTKRRASPSESAANESHRPLESSRSIRHTYSSWNIDW